MQFSVRPWPGRRTPGLVGGVLFLIGTLVTLTFLALLAVMGLVLVVLVGIAIGAERLLAALVPAYRRRRGGRYVTMPVTVRSMMRFAPGRNEAIEARSFELPDEEH